MSVAERDARYANEVGKRFFHLQLTAIVRRRGQGGRICGDFKCDCGKSIVRPFGRVKHGYVQHCGCLTDRGKCRTHGMRDTSEYAAWRGAKERCFNPNSPGYPRWGGRGITMSEEWVNDFPAFFRHIGHRPPGALLDRIDNNRGYEPGNVRWTNHVMQSENRCTSNVVTIHGVTFPSVEAAGKHYRVSAMTIVRWCCGYVDKRRSSYRHPPKPGCSMRKKYQ